MTKIHSLQLATIPFQAIASGEKVIESRLYDEKRRLIHIGDIIEFTNREAPEQMVSARVTGLLRYRTFHELFSDNDPNLFGGESREWLEGQINEFYSKDEQVKFGVLGIRFILAKSPKPLAPPKAHE